LSCFAAPVRFKILIAKLFLIFSEGILPRSAKICHPDFAFKGGGAGLRGGWELLFYLFIFPLPGWPQRLSIYVESVSNFFPAINMSYFFFTLSKKLS
jgi:hypothetical protein